jgi:hypothetical protein
MKATVITSFVDKKTKRLNTAGSVIELDEKRAKELGEKGYVKTEPEATRPKTEKQ